VTVAELIQHLQQFPQDLLVTYECCSEDCLLEAEQVAIGTRQPPRPDGWVHHQRPDKPAQDYLMFPGN
jgi:hypothetical protein